MAKINHEEYEILKGLDDYWKWKWIARDSAGLDNEKLFLYSEKPYKDYRTEIWKTDNNRFLPVDGHLFQSVRWEDREPYSIAELIREYESEETEVKKNIEWLKGRFAGRKIFSPSNDREIGYNEAIDEFSKYVDQLEEKEKVEVPQFVFDWIREHKNTDFLEEIHYLENSLTSQEGYTREEHELYFWIKKNFDTFAKAWITYPNIEVEEEQKYYIDLETAAYVAKWDGNGQVDIYTDGISGSDEYELHLTEKEIKDFDPRSWPFRKPVEELEE